jgi:tetratricopeptide (TPR) repeat protein
MWHDFHKVIELVNLNHPEALALKEAILACPDYQQANILLSKIKPEDELPGNSQEYQAIYFLCKACVDCEKHPKLGVNNASKDAHNAVRVFRSCGNSFNEGLACQATAMIYQKQGKSSMAIAEYHRAIEVFSPCLNLYETESDFDSGHTCRCQIKECEDALNAIEQNIASSSSQPSNQTNQPSKPLWPAASIIFGVRDFAHASRFGKYVMDDDLISEVEIEELVIGGELHHLFAAQTGNHTLTLTKETDYRWLRVAGESMNQAKPTAINPEDYVLADLSRSVNNGDIVIASFRNPPTPEERAGVIKRFGGKDLM